MMCDDDKLTHVMFDAVQAGVVVVDAITKKILYINSASAMLLGVHSEDVRGKECKEYLCAEDCDGCPVMTANIEEGVEDIENKEIVLRRKDGSQIDALLTIVSRIIDAKRLFINTIIDITKLREAEKRLERSWVMAGKLLEDNIIKLKNGGA